MDTLTHRICAGLAGTPERSRGAVLRVEDDDPVPVACVVLPDGDVLVPTGRDRTLARAARGRPVTIELTDDDAGWTMSGAGLARPLGPADIPWPLPCTGVLAPLRAAFRGGIRIRIARLAGRSLPESPDIPAQRTTEPAQDPAARTTDRPLS
ncbi:hypothetical protein B0I33_107142 [Prauserella shujinwangii]|uniref:Pyridoxamine 5'-phosphate oxidase-like protein n=1 Tax=Prauserella shujinwangii TaxID=1453103 RepID=A0A2T0LSH5_9PSEU|nr:hypothetical protein [Prauserella shujinwangii]PRX46565.1 hypothetical protein B0I33_107142 [Prauserella shujinwangii]